MPRAQRGAALRGFSAMELQHIEFRSRYRFGNRGVICIEKHPDPADSPGRTLA